MEDLNNFDTLQEEVVEEDNSFSKDLLCGDYMFVVKGEEGEDLRREKMRFFFPTHFSVEQIDFLVNKAYMQWLKEGLVEGSGYSMISLLPVEEYFYELNTPSV